MGGKTFHLNGIAVETFTDHCMRISGEFFFNPRLCFAGGPIWYASTVAHCGERVRASRVNERLRKDFDT